MKNIDSLDQLLDLIHDGKDVKIAFGGGMIDAERKTPMVGFEVDGQSYTFIRIDEHWWHQR